MGEIQPSTREFLWFFCGAYKPYASFKDKAGAGWLPQKERSEVAVRAPRIAKDEPRTVASPLRITSAFCMVLAV